MTLQRLLGVRDYMSKQSHRGATVMTEKSPKLVTKSVRFSAEEVALLDRISGREHLPDLVPRNAPTDTPEPKVRPSPRDRGRQPFLGPAITPSDRHANYQREQSNSERNG